MLAEFRISPSIHSKFSGLMNELGVLSSNPSFVPFVVKNSKGMRRKQVIVFQGARDSVCVATAGSPVCLTTSFAQSAATV